MPATMGSDVRRLEMPLCARRNSRFGCRNCKLRKVKCDESKPQCRRCCAYGVVCNFAYGVADLQSASEAKATAGDAAIAGCEAVSAGDDGIHRRIVALRGPISNAVWTGDGMTCHVLDAQDWDLLNRFRERTLSSMGEKAMADIFESHLLHKCFMYSFLMHGILAVASVHSRYLGAASAQRPSVRESYHTLQCTAQFNHWLGQPMTEERKDPTWMAAGMLLILTFSSTSPTAGSRTWPLDACDESDLQWLRLGNGKMRLWRQVNPLRPGSVFRPMFHNLRMLRKRLPRRGTHGLLPELAAVCGINESSSTKTNPYFAMAHALSRLYMLPQGRAPETMVLMVMPHMQGAFEDRLQDKDPIALLLLWLWYVKAREARWWLDFRARREIPAIRQYLQEHHSAKALPALLGSYDPSCW